MKKRLLWLVVLVLMTSLVAACGSKGSENAETKKQNNTQNGGNADSVTLKIMIPGDRPRDFDKVIDEAESRMADSLNIKLDVVFVPFSDIAQKTQVTLASGENIDLIFDAPWVHLNQMISDGYYEPLDELLQQFGPNVLSTRPEQMWEANTFSGKIMAIPLGNSFYQGRIFYVRKDIREKLGIEPITTYDQLIEFARAVKANEPDITPIISDTGAMSWAQFRKTFDYDSYVKDTQIGTNGILFHKNNDGKVYNMFEEMEPNVWTWIEDTRQLYAEGLIYPDVLSVKDHMQEFKTGKYAIANTNDFGVLTDVQQAVEDSVSGEVEAVTFFQAEVGANITDYKVWNFLALTSVSKNKEKAIQFLDWASQKENYDLLAYGIEGENWKAVGDDKYEKLNDGYAWFPFAWIWNPTHDRYDVSLGDEAIELSKFTAVGDNFEKDILTGFTFDTIPISNELAQLNTVSGKYMDPLSNGVSDPTETWEKYKSEASAPVKKIQEEMQKQINDFLANK